MMNSIIIILKGHQTWFKHRKKWVFPPKKSATRKPVNCAVNRFSRGTVSKLFFLHKCWKNWFWWEKL